MTLYIKIHYKASKMTDCVKFGIVVFLTISIFATIPAELVHEKVKKLAVANNNLALKLYQRLSGNSAENVFFSPFSLSAAFGMLFFGARGNTAEELKTVFGYKNAGLSNEQVHSSFNEFLKNHIPPQDSEDSEYILDIANLILVERTLQLAPNYKREVQKFYRAPVGEIDFGNGPSVVDSVNRWVKRKTRGKIDNILSSLNPSAVMVILNAIYFKADWITKFDPRRTHLETFYNNGLESGAKNVPTMYHVSTFSYSEVDDLKVLELPYKGGNISMVLFLPNARDGLPAIERRLSLTNIGSILQTLEQKLVRVSLPKFKLEYFKELSSEFQAMGASKIFRAGEADFSGMTPNKDVYVSEVFHKAVIEVSEEGSQVAAASAIAHNRMGLLDFKNFTANHPFLFAIIDKKSTMALFVGRVNQL